MSHDRRKKTRRTTSTQPAQNRRTSNRRTKQRREEPRIPIELWMEEMSGNDVYFRRTANIAIGGVYFDCAIPHAVGTTITLKFALPGDREMVVARGKVVNVKGPDTLGMGVKFISVEGDGSRRIRSHLQSQ